MKPLGSERGAAAIEFALVFPALLVLVLGSLEFGIAIYAREVVVHASREGARSGIVMRVPKPSAADIETVVKMVLSNSNVSTVASGSALVSVTGAAGNSGTNLIVSVSVPYTFATPLLFKVAKTINLTAQTVMVHE